MIVRGCKGCRHRHPYPPACAGTGNIEQTKSAIYKALYQANLHPDGNIEQAQRVNLFGTLSKKPKSVSVLAGNIKPTKSVLYKALYQANLHPDGNIEQGQRVNLFGTLSKKPKSVSVPAGNICPTQRAIYKALYQANLHPDGSNIKLNGHL